MCPLECGVERVRRGLPISFEPESARHRQRRHCDDIALWQAIEEAPGCLLRTTGFTGIERSSIDGEHQTPLAAIRRGRLPGGGVFGCDVRAGVGICRRERQRHNRPRLPVHEQRDLVGAEVGHLPVALEHAHVHDDQAHAGAERLLCAAAAGHAPQQRAQKDDRQFPAAHRRRLHVAAGIRRAAGGARGRRQRRRRRQSLMQVTRDQIRGMLTFSIETGVSSAWARNAGRSRSDLKPTWTVNGDSSRSAQDSSGLALRK